MCDVAAGIVDVGLEQDGVARSLVDLDSVAVGENSLELCTVKTGRAAYQRHAGGIEAELVLLQAATRDDPIGAGRKVIDKAAFAVLRRHHLVGTEDTEIFRDQGIARDRLAYGKGNLHRVGDQPKTFQFHLAARDIEACDQLLVGTCGSMGKHGFVKLCLHGAKLDVLHQEHRSLAQRRHRLVRGIGLIDP